VIGTPRRGGYYLDDGPEENPPDNLDRVPDAEPRPEPLHRFANNPYSVFGRDYVPATGLKPYRARGIASWYGKRFHGQKTSSGEPYDMYAMTAAHPTLPIPSYARVTNVANGRSVVVRINDRGPFHSDRIIDLSYTAAYKLGYIARGSTEVQVESIIPGAAPAGAPTVQARAASADPLAELLAVRHPGTSPQGSTELPSPLAGEGLGERGEPPKAAGGADGNVFLQLGVFSSSERAENLRTRVLRDLAWLGEKLFVVARDGKFRLHVGPYASAGEAHGIAERIRAVLDVKPLLIPR
jgi:rare lipoprotein A